MIRLYGHLRERFGEGFDLAVSSPTEAIRALCAVVPGFLESFREGSYQVLVGDEPQTMDTVPFPSGRLDISLVPVVVGGKSEFGQILMGVALIALSFAFPAIGPMLMGMGTSMVLGGIAQMLAGSPQVGGPDDPQNNGSFFSGPENTVVQGACLPVGYGKVLVGSMVVSAGTSAEAYPCGAGGGPFGANGTTWTKTGSVWSNGGNGLTLPLCLGVDPS